MGIHGIYKEIGPGQRIALCKLAVQKFEQTGRPLRIAIDTSIWLFQIQASKGGTNPALRTFYYRLLRLISLSIHPIFVFDGPNKPPFKRNKRTGPNVASIPEFLAKQLLKQFGFPIHLAPGEAEAECALLQQEGIVDAVLSEDVDTLMFGSGITIRNWSPEQKTSKTPTHVNVYDAVQTKDGPSGLDREGMILVALMSGGDYVPEGIPGCGPKTACEAARAGFGRDLCRIAKGDTRALQEWRDRLQHELKTNESKYFKRKHTTLKIPTDFPQTDILRYYTHPAISTKPGLDQLRRSIRWDQELDFPGLRDFTYDAFDWVKLEGAKHFIRSLAPSLLVRRLRLRAKQLEQTPMTDLQAIQEDEAHLVKGLHGKRQHVVTDHATEIRVSFTPIELVKIDLDKEEPDEDPEYHALTNNQSPEADLDDEAPLEIDDDAESGPKKRGPTKFDPHKPARIWVLESFVKVGVPLKVQDWESERQSKRRPKQTTVNQETGSEAPKARPGRKPKSAANARQTAIESFAKVRKPGVKASRAPAKAQDPPLEPFQPVPQPVSNHVNEVIDLLSSSPARPSVTARILQQSRDKSPSPVAEELPSSVTRRRRKRPMQRSHTLPVGKPARTDRNTTPPLMNTIETLDLVDPPMVPSPSPLPARKAKSRITRHPSLVRATRGVSVASSPGRTRQTTLDTWATPTKSKDAGLMIDSRPVPAAPQFQAIPEDVDTLDLTFSSPPTSRSRGIPGRSIANPPERKTLSTIPSNVSSVTTHVRPDHSRKTCPDREQNIEYHLQSTSANHQKTVSSSSEIETLDLTELSSPIHVSSLRRSPRHHSSPEPLPLSTRKTPSPPAAWKTQAKKKREVILRKSLAGAWDFVDVESPRGDASGVVLKGKERRRWRESEIEVLDLS